MINSLARDARIVEHHLVEMPCLELFGLSKELEGPACPVIEDNLRQRSSEFRQHLFAKRRDGEHIRLVPFEISRIALPEHHHQPSRLTQRVVPVDVQLEGRVLREHPLKRLKGNTGRRPRHRVAV